MEGLNCKNEKSNLKMQRPNMALTKHGIRANGLSFLRDQTVEREREGRVKERRRGRGRGRGREEEEKKKQSQKGMELWIFGMELHEILKFCMNFHAWMVSSLPKPRV